VQGKIIISDIIPPSPGKIRTITYFQKPNSASNEGDIIHGTKCFTIAD